MSEKSEIMDEASERREEHEEERGEERREEHEELPLWNELSIDEARVLLDRFRMYLIGERGRSHLTAEGYTSDLRQWLKFCETNGLVAFPPTFPAVSAFRKHMDEEGKLRSTQQRCIAAMRSWIHFVEMEEGEELEIPLPDLPDKTRLQPRILNEGEIKRLMDACQGTKPLVVRDRAIFEIGYGCGLRASEICGLDMLDLDFDSKILRAKGKGDKERVVPFLGEAARSVKIYLETARPQLKGDAGHKSKNKVFLSCSGRPLNRQDMWRILRKRGRQAGIASSRLYPHILRHSCATHLLARGMDMRTLQEMLGHSSIITTQTYAHFDREMRLVYDQFHPRA
ncbi:MAG: tyrosine-type recombinase/integrase [Synergistaceae bacterium]|jgi:integrase/recombinase XerD|nr:tyrosine-type recombinase/integrase [Synergistaceae bacterium]